MCVSTDSLNLLTVLLELTFFTEIPISQQIFLPSSPQAIAVTSVLVGFTKTQAAPGLTVCHVPAITTLMWQTQSPVTGSLGNAPSVYTTPTEQTASSANQGILAQLSIKTVEVSKQQHCNSVLLPTKVLKKLGCRERLALGGTVKLKHINRAKYESTKYISIQWYK